MKETSPEIEEYLEAIVRCKERGEKARVKDLAKELSVSPASVSGMLKSLSGKGLLSYERYGEITLTPDGEKLGRAILRKHRLVERFLALIGIKSEKLHDEACLLEHAISDEVESAMGRVVFRAGRHETPLADVKALSDMAEREQGEVLFTEGGSQAHKRLADMGLTPGVRITVSRPSRRAGPVGVLVRSSSLAIGRELAKKVFVRVKR